MAVKPSTKMPPARWRDSEHPYDRGYWKRYRNEARPRSIAEREGWDVCDRELRAEKTKRDLAK